MIKTINMGYKTMYLTSNGTLFYNLTAAVQYEISQEKLEKNHRVSKKKGENDGVPPEIIRPGHTP